MSNPHRTRTSFFQQLISHSESTSSISAHTKLSGDTNALYCTYVFSGGFLPEGFRGCAILPNPTRRFARSWALSLSRQTAVSSLKGYPRFGYPSCLRTTRHQPQLTKKKSWVCHASAKPPVFHNQLFHHTLGRVRSWLIVLRCVTCLSCLQRPVTHLKTIQHRVTTVIYRDGNSVVRFYRRRGQQHLPGPEQHLP